MVRLTLPVYFAIYILLFIAALAGCRQPETQNSNAGLQAARKVADSAYDLMGGKQSAGILKFIDSAFSRLPQNPLVRWVRFRTLQDYNENYTGDTIRQHRYIDSMFLVLKPLPYRPELAQTILAHSRLLQAEKQYDAAFRELQNGSLMARHYGDDCGLADFYNHMGVIRYQQEQYRTAIGYLKNALSDDEGCALPGDFTYTVIMHQSLLNTTGLCYQQLGLADSAIVCYRQALDFVRAEQPRYPAHANFIESAQGVILGNLGGAYAKKGNDSAAIRYLREAIATNDQPGFAIEDAQNNKIKLANVFLQQRQAAAAAALLHDVAVDLDEGRGRSIMRNEVWRDYLSAMAALSRQRGDFKNAYQYSLAFHRVADSLHALKDQLIRADMDRLFAANQGQRLLETTAKNDRLKTWLLIILVSCLTLVAIAAGIAVRQLRRSTKLVGLLKLTNQRLEDNIADLEASRDENTRILQIIAHDLRNPLGAIYSATNLLSEIDVRTENPEPLISLIGECSHTAMGLVADLLDGRTASEKKSAVDIALLLEDQIAWIEHQARAKQQKIHLAADHTLLSVDKRQIGRVISNILNNAVKFSPQHTIIDVIGVQTGQEYLVRIRDQGLGIPEHLLDKLFDAEADIRRPGTDGERSYGLGLAICRELMQNHQGSIRVESTPGVGTVFFLSFPMTSA